MASDAQSKSSLSDLYAWIDDHAAETVAMLQRLVRQPSVAAQNIGMPETAALVEELLGGAGVPTRQIATGGYPVVFGEAPGRAARTLLFYNHYDVQPADPLDLWASDPWVAEVRDGRIWGRGVSDNKGNIAARIAAIQAWRAVRGELPLTVKFVVEGEEEIGSPNLGAFAEAHRDLIRADGCIWEFGTRDLDGRPLVHLGLKGICYVELRCRGAKGDQHSSVATSVPNPAWRLVWALAGLKGPNERVRIPGFYDSVRPPSADELAMVAAMPDLDRQRLDHLGIDAFLLGASGAEVRRRDAFEPTCTISGIVSGYTGEGSKTVLPAEAMAKVDMRLVPDQDPHQIAALLRRHLDAEGFADIELELLGPEMPARTPPSAPIVQTVIETAREIYNAEPVVVPSSGGSGPWWELCGRWGIDACTAGVGHARSDAHAPNENIYVDDLIRGAKHIAAIMDRFARI